MSFDEKLVEYFLKFPGIGPRQAKRFAYFLANEDSEFIKNLSDEISKIKNKIKQCQSCFRFFSSMSQKSDICSICSSLNRDNSLLMIVEKDVDLDNIEKTGMYNGKYFVLGGVLVLSNGNEKKLRLKELFSKIQKDPPTGGQKEIILAIGATIEGENTARYIEKILEPLKIKITRLGRGLSTGTELEYIDSETFNNALKNRK